METARSCGCKGIRTCLICEKKYRISKPPLESELKKAKCYVYCPDCNKAWPGWNVELLEQHPDHVGEPIHFPGAYIKPDFLDEKEANLLMAKLDSSPWDPSQSGRRKQNYGPKCNFKKRRLALGSFAGFPESTKFVQEKLQRISLLHGFRTIEQCTLEYDPDRGASVDPHIDDCWIWGERVVTVNVTGDCVLTMIRYHGPATRYNLTDIAAYPPVVKVAKIQDNVEELCSAKEGKVIVRLPMPAKSLVVLYGDARYKWEHAVLREDVSVRRVCLTYREFTPLYLDGGTHFEEASQILERASNFW